MGIKPRILKKNGGTPLQFLKVQVSLLLGAAGKAEIKIESEETFLSVTSTI